MKVLILNQAFYPDVVSTGQHATDLAVTLVGAGHQVTVVASARGYDDPSLCFPSREVWKGINIHRVVPTGFGKASRWRRAADFASFLVKCIAQAAFLPSFDVVIALTSPPLISVLAALLAPLRRAAMLYWTMDVNPDEAIATGWIRSDSLTAKVLGSLQQFSLRRADAIVVLDRFMKERIRARGIDPGKIVIVPPWPQDDKVAFDAKGREEFRRLHALEGKFVIMHAGNHSPCHPLQTLLEAARQLSDHPRFMFCFVGGGSEFSKVRQFASANRLRNIVCLPYEPLDKLAGTLSAADMQVAVMGDPLVGIVHPCKVYNILAVGAPLLYIGPELSHITEIIPRTNCPAFSLRHGDIAGVVKAIQEAARIAGPMERSETIPGFSVQELLPRMVALVEAIGAQARPEPRRTAAIGIATDIR